MTHKWRRPLWLLACSLILPAVIAQRSEAGGALCAIMSDRGMESGVALLREQGPEGLRHALAAYEMLQINRQELQIKLDAIEASGSSDDEKSIIALQQQISEVELQLERLAEAIDQIGAQRGCTVSGLYWYTDLDDARAAAERTGRPILSLRMLGKLTDEFSCANSRFFRTALYSNKLISDSLRNNFVLHWQSVRPVPRVTIDFGDGRKLQRTLTGNSAHYVLTATGRPLDVLPGLYSPNAFFHWLHRMNKFHSRFAAADENAQTNLLANFHREQRSKVFRQWAHDLQRLGEKEVSLVTYRIDQAIERAQHAGEDHPLALAAAKLAPTKMQAETPLLRYANFSGPWIEAGMDGDLWQALASLHRDNVQLDETSVAVMRAEFPRAAQAGELAVTKRVQEDPILRVVRLFEDSMALDTVRNEYLLHRMIHDRFVDAAAEVADVTALNEWVYAEVFLTPSSDPWLGLAPPDVYTALENDGRIEPAATVASRAGG